MARSKVERIFIASWGSMRPSLIRSSKVSVRDKPILDQEDTDVSIHREPGLNTMIQYLLPR